MQALSKFILGALILTLVLIAGCSDRGGNSPATYIDDSGVRIKDGGHVFFYHFPVQINNSALYSHKLYMAAYNPYPQAWGPPPFYEPPQKLPVLILLPPSGGNEYYYFTHGLAEIANDLLTEGLIEPMLIVSFANDATFGGYWWAGTGGGAGDYDGLIADSLMPFLWTQFFEKRYTDTTQGMTGIGGYGDGAYGAIRAAMKNPGHFGSVSVIDGPLDFDGPDGASGLLDLFHDALIEQGLLGNALFAQQWDSSRFLEVSRILTGGALAFSPHDTLVLPVITQLPAGKSVAAPDSILVNGVYEQRRWKLADSTTLVSNVVQDDNFNFDFHLPFNENGAPYAPIWNTWLSNCPVQMLDTYADNLRDIDIWIAANRDNDPLGYGAMTASFGTAVRAHGIPREEVFYSGYDGNPAQGDTYLSEMLRKLLIFHSNSFKKAREGQPAD